MFISHRGRQNLFAAALGGNIAPKPFAVESNFSTVRPAAVRSALVCGNQGGWVKPVLKP
jgi:hypothetical protein